MIEGVAFFFFLAKALLAAVTLTRSVDEARSPKSSRCPCRAE